MNLDEGMPAPAARSKGRRPVRWKIPAAVGGVAVAAVLVVPALVAPDGGAELLAPAQPPPAAAPVDPAGHGHDQGVTTVDPAAWSTFVAFWSAWSNESQKTRTAVFADTATKGLADGLAETASYKMTTVRQPVEKVEIAGTGLYSTEFRVTFRNVDTGPVRVSLVADPEAKSGWLVNDISQIGA